MAYHAISIVVVARVSINFCVSLSKVQAELHPIFILLFYVASIIVQVMVKMS